MAWTGEGIIDVWGADRVADVTKKGMQDIGNTMTNNVNQALSGWSSDMPELEKYRTQSGNAVGRIDNAGVTPDSASAWLNPQMDLMLNRAGQAVRGSQGGAMSSANNNAVTDRVAGMAGDMWQQATQNAFQNSANEQNIGKTTADIYQQQFENDMLPKTVATQARLDSNTAQANLMGQMYGAQAASAGQNQGILHTLGL